MVNKKRRISIVISDGGLKFAPSAKGIKYFALDLTAHWPMAKKDFAFWVKFIERQAFKNDL